jgi:hypothetical protein
MTIHSKKSLRAIQHGIDNLEDFDIANMSGRNYSKWSNVPKGYLPEVWNAYNEHNEHYGHLPVYVIFSYKTPIAWTFKNNRKVWTIPDVTYSTTTTNHQHIVRVATANKGFYNRF